MRTDLFVTTKNNQKIFFKFNTLFVLKCKKKLKMISYYIILFSEANRNQREAEQKQWKQLNLLVL
jgi:hypothetical protein